MKEKAYLPGEEDKPFPVFPVNTLFLLLLEPDLDSFNLALASLYFS